MIPSIPIVELFLAGVFAVVGTQAVKAIFNVTESGIGIHNANTGQLIKTRYATIVYVCVILISNISAFITYTVVSDWLQSQIPVGEFLIDVIIVSGGVLIVWIYLKTNHYSRSDS